MKEKESPRVPLKRCRCGVLAIQVYSGQKLDQCHACYEKDHPHAPKHTRCLETQARPV